MKMFHVYGVRYDDQKVISEEYENENEASERSQQLYNCGYDDWGYYEYTKD